MGWYVRKALSFGPLRINLSKSGVGWSVGARGLRYGQSARGQRYIHAGTGGLYYRQTLGSAAKGTPAFPQAPAGATSPISTVVPHTTFAGLVTQAQQLTRWDRFVGIGAAVVSFVALLNGLTVAIPVTVVGVVVWYLAYLWEVRRRVVTVDFRGNGPKEQRIFAEVTEAVSRLGSAKRMWAVTAPVALGVSAAKVHAGASSTVERVPLLITSVEPDWVQIDLEVLNLRGRSWHMSFLPTGLLVVANKSAAFAPYDQVSVHGQQIRFIERDPAADSPVSGKTWSFANKDGSPDRRYSQNSQVSVCEVGQVRVTMQGAAVEFQVSNPLVAKAFVDELARTLTLARSTP